jgi:hypothetical protein
MVATEDLIFLTFKYVEPLVIEIFFGSLMTMFPRFFAGFMFLQPNDHSDIAIIFLGFMLMAFGIIHFGIFYLLTKNFDIANPKNYEVTRFQKEGLALLMSLLFIGDIAHLAIMGVLIAWRYDEKNILLSPPYYYQFSITILAMLGRIYVLQNIESITNRWIKIKAS